MTPAIHVQNLTKRYGGREVVAGISFEVQPGELFSLLGPNGAGKTTTIETLEGYRRPDSGQVRVLGLDPAREGSRLYRRIGVMLQEGGLYPTTRPGELLRLYSAFYDDPEPIDKLVEQLGLRDVLRTPVQRLSGGQRQRLSLALALIGRPELLFLDEPTSGLDPQARQDTWAILRSLHEQGRTIVLTTHYLEEAEQLADRVAIMNAGKLVALDTPANLVSRSRDQFRFRVAEPLDVQSFPLPLEPEENGWYLAPVPASPRNVRVLAEHLEARDVRLLELQTGTGSLERAFLTLTSQEAGE